ncbi:N-acetylglucosamine kinase [Paenibacillus sp. FA6]|uniref:N-acetylglucosamine kinase n=1 Tax=Paenibacillus sp. FA6 TaxID=3413029 RepID=UPI003F6594C1
MKTKVAVGIDGGGSHTRILVVDQRGQALSYIETGGSNPYHHQDADRHLQDGIREALEVAGRTAGDVVSLTAGLAGLDDEKGYLWANQQLAATGIMGTISAVNDAYPAQMGAFLGESGIVAICGTGSIIYGRNEQGKEQRNYQFEHYAPAAARFIGYDAVYRIIAGRYVQADLSFVREVLDFFQLDDADHLAQMGAIGFYEDAKVRNRIFGHLAPLVTLAAEGGVPLACEVCDRAAESVVMGISLVGSTFHASDIRVSFIGSVLLSTYMKKAVLQQLSISNTTGRNYVYSDAQVVPVVGAVIHALKEVGLEQSTNVFSSLQRFVQSHIMRES